LGNVAIMTRVEVSWPSGLHQEFQHVPADAIYEIDEGQPIHQIAVLRPVPVR